MSRFQEYLEAGKSQYGKYRIEEKKDKVGKDGKKVYSLILKENGKDFEISWGSKEAMQKRAKKEEERQSLQDMYDTHRKEREFGA